MAEISVNSKLVFLFFLIAVSLVAFISISSRNKLVTSIVRNNGGVTAVVGAGIIFPFSYVLCSFIYEDFEIYALVGLSLISIISLIDDVRPIEPIFRFFIQILATGLVFYGFHNAYLVSTTSILAIVIMCVLVLSYVNAYNFMDGINGMLGLNTILTIGAFIFINHYQQFINPYILYGLFFSGILFLIGNFRLKPIFISGDVGSVSIGFMIGYFTLKYYLTHDNPVIFLLMVIYLIDTGATILFNISTRTPVFKRHRNHLYEKLVFTNKFDDRKVSAVYGGIQLTICLLVIYCIVNGISNWSVVIISTGCLIIIYIIFRYYNYINETRSKTTN